MYYIGIDLGTSAVKLLLVDENGGICNEVTREYPWSSQVRLEPAGPGGLEKGGAGGHPRPALGL